MNYFQKVIIKSNETSNEKLMRATWTQNGEDIRISSLNNEIILYRKFDPSKKDNVDLYFETDNDSYAVSFEISDVYKFEIIIDIIISHNKNIFLYIDDQQIKMQN